MWSRAVPFPSAAVACAVALLLVVLAVTTPTPVCGILLVPTPLSALETSAVAVSVVERDAFAFVDGTGRRRSVELQRVESGLLSGVLTSFGAAYGVHLAVDDGRDGTYRLAEDTSPELLAPDWTRLRELLRNAVEQQPQSTQPQPHDVAAFVQALFAAITNERRGGGATLRQLGRWVARASDTAVSAAPAPPAVMAAPADKLLRLQHLDAAAAAADANARAHPSDAAAMQAAVQAHVALHDTAEALPNAALNTQAHMRAAPVPAAAATKESLAAPAASTALKSASASISGDASVAAPLPSPLKHVATQDGHVTTLWYGTNRVPVGEDEYGPAFSNTVHVGQLQVLVPHAHVPGETGSSWAWRTYTGVDDRLRVTYFNELTRDAFWARLKASVAFDQADSALVFIHGYCNTFRDAAIRTAQLAFDLHFTGVAAFYSWPSRGDTTGYAADEQNVARSVSLVSQWLHDLVVHSGIKRVHIIAHSMGNRALLHALHDITVQMQLGKFDTAVRFEQIVLAAPDLGEIEFEQLQQAYTVLGKRSTIYVSASDRALQLSAAIHGDTRVGLESVTRAGFDVIDASGVDLTTLGHGYIAESRPVLHDVAHVLRAVSVTDRHTKGHVEALTDGVWALTGINQSAAFAARSAHAQGTTPLLGDVEFAAAVAAARLSRVTPSEAVA